MADLSLGFIKGSLSPSLAATVISLESFEKIFELAIDAGADECFSLENFHEIHCGFEDIYSIKKKIESHVENFISTDIEWLPLNKISSKVENKENIKKTEQIKKGRRFSRNFLERLQ